MLYNRSRLEGWKKRRPGKTLGSGTSQSGTSASGNCENGTASAGLTTSVASETSETVMHSVVSGKKITSKIKDDKFVARYSEGSEAVSVANWESVGETNADTNAGLGASGERSVGTRLYEVLEIKLAEIEDRIARGEQLSPEGNEREQRVIGNLIRNFDKLTEFNERRTRGAGKPGERGAKSGGAGDGGASDLSKLNAMQFREEIARRIEHFEKEWKS